MRGQPKGVRLEGTDGNELPTLSDVEEDEPRGPLAEGEIDEEETVTPTDQGSSMDGGISATMREMSEQTAVKPENEGHVGMSQERHNMADIPSSSASYGPIRRADATDLTEVLRRGVEMLDMERTRASRTPYSNPPAAEDGAKTMLVEETDVHESFLAQQKREAELKNKDIQEHEWDKVLAGKRKEFDKLEKTQSIKIHSGSAAEKIRRETAPERI